MPCLGRDDTQGALRMQLALHVGFARARRWLPVLVMFVVATMPMLGAPPTPRASIHDLAGARYVQPPPAADAAQKRWPDGSRIVFLIDATDAPDGGPEAVLAAASTWASTGIDIEFVHGGEADRGGFDADEVNVVSWIDTPDDADRFVARTMTYWFDDRPDEIVGFDLAFNLDHPFTVEGADEAWDLETVALHEFGHVLGLSHADPDRVLQVMRPRIEAGAIDHTLSLADLRVLRRVYGDRVDLPAGGFFRSSAPTSRAGTTASGVGLFDADATGDRAPIERDDLIVAVGEGLYS